jgi:hypothetical protein
MLVATLHHIAEDDDPAEIVARYLAPLAPGSYLVLSHYTDELAYERVHESAAEANRMGAPLHPRSRDAIERLFNGRPLIDPGLVLVSYWRPEDGQPEPNADRAWAYGGITRL